MNKVNTFKWMAVLLTVFGLLASCDEQEITAGGGIIGGNNFETSIFEDTQILSYGARSERVQTNALVSYQLGVYTDPIYGRTVSNFLSQILLQQPAPNFGTNPEIQSVKLSLPYFSTLDITSDEANTYILDSLYGDSPVKLTVYRSEYFLRTIDPDADFDQSQKYYSNQGPEFESFLGEVIYEDPSFVPSNESITINQGEPDEEVLSPRLYVDLDIDYWTDIILGNEGGPELVSNSNWVDFFRGLHFVIEPLTDNGNLFYFETAGAGIQINYRNEAIDVADTDEDGDTTDIIFIDEVFNLSFGGVSVNTFDSEFPADIDAILDDQDTVNGEETLYLKGGSGAVGVIELFGPDNDGDGEADQLTELKQNNWLINEARLTVFVDQNEVPGGDSEPERLFLYDLDNGRVLIDYEIDNTFANTSAELKSSHLGIVERDDSNNGISYRLRLTTHVSNIIRNDSTNVRLGLAVAQDVLSTNFRDIDIPDNPDINRIPTGGINSPEGTIVYGTATPLEAKRLKLIIYYTDPDD